MGNTASLEKAAGAGTNSRQTAGIVAAILASVIVLVLPTPEGLSAAGHRLAAIFVGALVLWATEALPMAVTAIMAVALQPLLGITAIVPAINSAMSPIFFFVLVMFIIAFAWMKTGLAQRFALYMISKAGTDAKRVVFVFMFGTGVLSTFVSDVPTAAIFMAIALSIFDKLNLKPGESQFGRVVMLGIPIASLIGGIGTPAGSSINLMGLDMMAANGGPRIPFGYWMMIGVPMVVILLPVAAFVLLKFFPPEIKSIGTLADIQQDRMKLGAITANEWKVIVLTLSMLVIWTAGTWFPTSPYMNVYTVALLGGILMFVPGINLFSWKEAQGVIGWDTLVLIMGITSLGAASSASGLAKWLADTTFGGLESYSPAVIVAIISAFTVVIHLMLPIAPVINAVMIPPMIALATAAGQNPALYALPVIFTASCAFLLPLDAVPLVTYSKGYYKFYDMWKPGIIISIVWVIIMTAAMLTIGPALGLI